MQIIVDPIRETWKELLKRPAIDTRELAPKVASIMDDVRVNGDVAVMAYTTKFDGIETDTLRVSREEIEAAIELVPQNLKDAITTAKNNIEKFHAVVIETPETIETAQGVFCWKKRVPIEKVGLYIPAGSAPLFSTVLMLAVPAQLAGCEEVILCSPASSEGTVNAATLYAADLCGVTSIFKIGGAQAIAAMAYGTESIPQVYKIFGPGNQFVTEAKLQAMRNGVAIDMPAGPSEVAIIADESCIPQFVAADLLSQAEHGPDSQVILVSDSRDVVERTIAEVKKQLPDLPRQQIAAQALASSKFLVVSTLADAINLINAYAPEHLIMATADADSDAEKIHNAGSVFIGNYSCESSGDYASGTNHTLPTNGAARAYSGVSVESFTRTITFQKLSANGIEKLGTAIETMAAAEGLDAHARAVSIRREFIKNRENGK